ncbi:uncharacterized protein FRV6_14226 [Fusarium oxysporum]|uniref:Uncharacterized protein n=1 Tax=Fusarium oxysporum TaxID=5507 RepID=A0A2H3TN80_FUSOX|nr:uncharacterized protein FRV6_14226 [Fusarium oxysporum]
MDIIMMKTAKIVTNQEVQRGF